MTMTIKQKNPRASKYELTIGWLYPELMSTYGDRGNVLILENRMAWRGMTATTKRIDFSTTPEQLRSCDIILGGGAQDRQQTIMVQDIRVKKGETLRSMFDVGIPGLFVCGSPQLLGHFYMTGDGDKLDGLGIFDMVTKHFGHDKPRCIGNTIGNIGDEYKISGLEYRNTIVGFENHGGRTYLGKGVKPFAKVVKGNGNNAEDGTEGAVYKNCIAT